MSKMNVERLLAAQGFGSRRECRGMLLAGRVAFAGVAGLQAIATA